MNAPSFQFYAQDFLTGVMYLTNEEIGMYIKMLAKQWTDEKIPKKRLGFLVGCEWDDLSDELKSKFIENEGFIFNERLENERKKRLAFLEKQRANGLKGGRKPKPLIRVKPNESQKKPLEDEIEVEEEYRNIIIKKVEKIKLVEKYGIDGYRWIIDKLSNYKLSSGKEYKSDYGAINSWVVKEWKKEKSVDNSKVDSAILLQQDYGIHQ